MTCNQGTTGGWGCWAAECTARCEREHETIGGATGGATARRRGGRAARRRGGEVARRRAHLERCRPHHGALARVEWLLGAVGVGDAEHERLLGEEALV